ncbi:MAG: tetratricopeptide repeat protein [Candidatus Scalindua sp.]|nr:tetratricopeptide repeat protein [Candidatus Scalindua sp.]
MIDKLKEGESLYAEGRLEEAESCFLSVIEDDSKNKVAYNNMGVVAYRMNDIERAFDYFAMSLKEDPYFEDAITNLLDLLGALDCTPLVVSYIGAVTEFDPQVN